MIFHTPALDAPVMEVRVGILS